MTRSKGQDKLGAQNVTFTYQALTQNIGDFTVQCSLELCYLYNIIMLDELGLGTMESVLAIADVLSCLVLPGEVVLKQTPSTPIKSWYITNVNLHFVSLRQHIPHHFAMT